MDHKKKDKHFIHKPIYEGGDKALRAFVGQHLQYPELALTHKVEGTVHVEYDIDHKGDVVDARVIGGLGYGLDEEAMRVVRLLKFSVAKHRGIRVLFHRRIQVHFRLPKAQPAAAEQPQGFQYVYTPETPDQNQEKQPGNGAYTFTITI
ncbi:MAG: energy transducer TonB [Saprospiraceae bacterium]|nr:energy transducer TonB [Saprospiraceae bacterium]